MKERKESLKSLNHTELGVSVVEKSLIIFVVCNLDNLFMRQDHGKNHGPWLNPYHAHIL